MSLDNKSSFGRKLCLLCFSGIIRCMTIFSHQWWPVATVKLAGVYVGFYSVILSLYFSLEMLHWDSDHGRRVWHASLSVPQWEAAPQHPCFHSIQSCIRKSWINSATCSKPFACGYPGCIFSRRGEVSCYATVGNLKSDFLSNSLKLTWLTYQLQ